MESTHLDKYLDDIGRESLLSAADEKSLSDRIKAGDYGAVNKLVEANLRFVVKIASQYRGRGVALDDLISEGNIGMLRAAMKFDADRGARFVSYASAYIRQHIEKAIDDQTSQYKLPQGADTQSRRTGRALSVDAPLGTKSNLSLLSVLANQNAPMADERVYSEAIENAIEFAMLSLNTRESGIIDAFFGLTREHETMAEIAERMGLKRERVRQIRNRAIRRMKKAYRSKLAELRR